MNGCLALLLIFVMGITGCGNTKEVSSEKGGASGTDAAGEEQEAPVIPGLTYESKMDLTYAEVFNIYYYSINILGVAP